MLEENLIWGSDYSSKKSLIDKTLETIVETGKHALHAANPLRDVKNTYEAAKNLVTKKPSVKKYLKNAAKGKIFGEGNLSRLVFNASLFASGMYVPLSVSRAAIGGAMYLGKSAITSNIGKSIVSSVARLSSPVIGAAGKLIGVSYKTTKEALSKQSIDNYLDKWRDNDYFKEKVFPFALECAVGLHGYGSLVGAKWIGDAGERFFKRVKENVDGKYGKVVSGAGEYFFGFCKNLFTDILTAAMAKNGYEYISNLDLGDYVEERQYLDGLNGLVDNAVKDYQNTSGFISENYGYLRNDFLDDLQEGYDDLVNYNVNRFINLYEEYNLKESAVEEAKRVGYNMAADACNVLDENPIKRPGGDNEGGIPFARPIPNWVPKSGMRRDNMDYINI